MMDTPKTPHAIEVKAKGGELVWRTHMPNLLHEIACNPTVAILKVPLNIVAQQMAKLADLAIEIDDPRLHLMMMDLTLYDNADPERTPPEQIAMTRSILEAQATVLRAKKKA
jgi:hypothetical protein